MAVECDWDSTFFSPLSPVQVPSDPPAPKKSKTGDSLHSAIAGEKEKQSSWLRSLSSSSSKVSFLSTNKEFGSKISLYLYLLSLREEKRVHRFKVQNTPQK